MNTKNNAIFRETSEKFENALIELLHEHSIEKITINMLCEKTGLHRSTFYTHYYSIYELLESTGNRIKDEVIAKFDEVSDKAFSVERYKVWLKEIKENRYIYIPLQHSNCNYVATKRKQSTILKTLKDKGYDEVTVDYMVQFWYNGISSVIGKWIESGCQDDIETIAKALHKCSEWI